MQFPHVIKKGLLAVSLIGAVTACASSGSVTKASPASNERVSAASTAVDISHAPTYKKEFGTMWTFDSPPLEYWKYTYGFTPPAGWLDNIRLSSVRLPGCSASFVSEEGLVMTNHHCVRGCVSAVSPKDTNYMETGFTAAGKAQEKVCPGTTLDQLQSIEDITSRIQVAMNASTDAERNAQRSSAIATIQQECTDQTGLRCQVVSLYNGGRYSLYRYKRYTDVRLVMAPDEQAGFFGGDPDNFTFPRYALDVIFLRAYENGQPASSPNYLKWSHSGARENELTFVVGNPGSTERLSTVAQLEYSRDIGYPMQLANYVRNLIVLREEAATSAEKARSLQNSIFGYENSFKAVSGFWSGLKDKTLMDKKRAFEAEVRARVNADPALRAEYGKSWDLIEAAVRDNAEVRPRLTYYFGGNSSIFGIAKLIVQTAAAPADDSIANVYRSRLSGPQPIDNSSIEYLIKGFALQLRDAANTLPATDPYLVLALSGRTPEQAASDILANTQLLNPEFRRSLLQGGPAAIQASTDPLITFVRNAEVLEAPLRERAQRAAATISANTAVIGRALFAVYGTILPPDATFTLRISDGIVKGYPMNGTVAPYKTTTGGLYSRAADFNNVYPWRLSVPFEKGRSLMNMDTPFNFVSTHDIIGGNSGSPVINQNGEVVGLIFDGNIESLPNRFVFTDEAARSVSVHSQIITEALRKLYNGNHIVDEIEGKAKAK